MASLSLGSVLESPSIPTLPGVALEVLDLTRDQNVNLNRIAQVVQNDQALTSKILRTVNSSFYGLSKPCPTIARAIAYLGLNTVKSLVLGFSLVDSVNAQSADGPFDYVSYWRRTIYGAAAARHLATRTGAVDPDEAFVAALLRDLGQVAMYRAASAEYVSVLSSAPGFHETIVPGERAEFGFAHADLGAALARKWRLPESLSTAIEFHHAPDSPEAAHHELSQHVALADIAAEALTHERVDTYVSRFTVRANEWFAIDCDESPKLLRAIGKSAAELSSLFQLDTGKSPDLNAMLIMANERLVEHQMAIQEETERLRRTNVELARSNAVDALTGAFNRRHFDDKWTVMYEKAIRSNQSLAVAFIDADRFKSVNDTHGHQAGDLVLVELSKRFRHEVGERGVVCRYGGEEFAVILPDCSRTQAAQIAEQLRREVEAAPIDLREIAGAVPELAVTVSIGVAATEPISRHAFASHDQLLKAADKAVYAAKAGGRNCVRVFNHGASRRRTGIAESPASPSAERPAAGQASEIRILVVEDDPLCAQIVATRIRECVGVAVPIIEASAEAAMSRMMAERIDVIFCELDLPGLSGIDFVKGIREDARTKALPIVMLSAADDPETVQACRDAGADLHVSKRTFAREPREAINRAMQVTAQRSAA